MTTQVMDPAVGHRNWNSPSYLMAGPRPQSSMPSASRLSAASLAPSTYVHADAIPAFSNPFGSRSTASDLYIDTGLDAQPGPESARTSMSSSSSSQFQYQPAVTTAASSGPAVTQQMYDQSLLGSNLLGSDLAFSTAPSPVNAAYPTTSFDVGTSSLYAAAPMGVKSYHMDVSPRRSSQPSLNVPAIPGAQDVLGMDQDTPRGPYAPSHRGRSAADSNYFPSAHSSTSSISSSVGSDFSHFGSMGGSSISDYSDVEASMGPSLMRTSQAPSMLSTSTSVPAQASMMTQFSSKVSSSVQKKHVCKICEKRFTRPSSLQTHVYSHTGEKPYQCNHPGCGRCFSVVSNLRRHQKIHRNRDQSDDSRSEAESPASHITDCDD